MRSCAALNGFLGSVQWVHDPFPYATVLMILVFVGQDQYGFDKGSVEDKIYVSCFKTDGFGLPSSIIIIIGASYEECLQFIALFGSVYANIRKHQGLPFRFPGNRYDASDARVLAEQHIWAAVSEKAKNQAFNCPNGDVFTWKSFWKELCKVFDVQFVQFDVIEIMKKNAPVWDQIVEDHGLFRTKIEDLITSFEFQHVSNMTESRDFG
ncbi:3-oxo-Delta(4,5)-steroid 5-beta-reductase-like [Herrania umbratica]|uniref:3-oxo-Delta(4,5)-steroid 5-beta-reductase-like n=1 Tax=Herrania umbratica TaxID=108875 RepID=A0A6J1BKK5_9ROSI|nr:3-oxo-Delta(4,5)-steroid 5-beta-reductase-like [Herrania umbratica]